MTVIDLTTVQKITCVAALICVSAGSLAQRSSELSADFPDSRTIAVQKKVERLFNAGKYERAFFIYRNELTPVGDKYAQYMVGFMYQSGLGVAEDIVAASAWYQLAAERDTREFVVVRDKLLHVMDGGDAERSILLYRELRLRYSDVAVLLSSIKRNLRERRLRTGSRVGGQSSPVSVIENSSSGFRSSSDFYESIQKELEDRLILLKEISEFDDLDTDPDRIDFQDLERRVLQYIKSDND